MAWAFSALKDSHRAESHPVVMNKASRCWSWPNAIPRKECGTVPDSLEKCAAKCLDSDWFQLSNQVISTLFIVLQIPVRQHVSNDLEMPAKSCFMGTNMTCPNIPNPLSRLHALRRCRFILIQKWILKTIAEQNKTINKKRLTDRRWKGSVESKKRSDRNWSKIEMRVDIVNAFCGHVPPSKTLTLFESKALSLVLPWEATISAKLSLLTRCPAMRRGLVQPSWFSELPLCEMP